MLSIGKNQLKEDGAINLAKAQNLDQLQELILNDNDIKEEGTYAI